MSKANWEGMKSDTNIFCLSYYPRFPKTVEDNYSTIESYLQDLLNKHAQMSPG